MPRGLLLLEFLAIFVALPLAYRFSPVRIPALSLLWIVAGYALWQLLRDPRFDRTRLWNTTALAPPAAAILTIFALVAVLLWLGVHRFAPELEWSFVRSNPVFWALVMVAYPVLSVYPQGILYRAFFFERYALSRQMGHDRRQRRCLRLPAHHLQELDCRRAHLRRRPALRRTLRRDRLALHVQL
jgi:hypothetical protein